MFILHIQYVQYDHLVSPNNTCSVHFADMLDMNMLKTHITVYLYGHTVFLSGKG